MISRSNMRRQLQANGGIMNARQGYGIGSFVKEKIRKLIPNELADIAVKAAPFVAPFQPGIAAAMRGIGRFDQRGSVSDALKQAGGTYAFGKAANYGLSKIPTGAGGSMAKSNAANTAINSTTNAASQKQIGTKLLGNLTKKIPNIPGLGSMGELAKQQLLTGTITGGLTYMYEKFIKEEPPQEEGETQGEYMARRDKNVRKKMRGYMDNYLAFDPEYSKLDDAGKDEFVKARSPDSVVQAAEGGLMRAGYAMGTPLPNDPTKPINPFGPKPTGPVLPSNDKMADARSQLLMQRIEELMDEGLDYNAARAQAEREVSSKNMGGLMRTGYANGSEEFQSYLKGRQKFEKEMSLEEYYKDFLRMKKDQRIAEEKTMAADGGLMRLNYMIGGEAKQMEAGAPPIIYEGNMDPNAQAGLPSVPGPMQMAEDGPEFDMRENGGFQPLGRQEGKDDVPAMLAKNEFVMTADAVRAAGGGSIQKGAQKMYDTMKKLESRVS